VLESTKETIFNTRVLDSPDASTFLCFYYVIEEKTFTVPTRMPREPGNGLQQKIRVGISSCLLGNEVRFDAGHKYDSYINGTLSQYFEFVPVCPEVAIGMTVPREPIRLVGDAARPRAVGVRTVSLDVTEALELYGQRMAVELTDLCGYILKRASPSCGMERVKVYSTSGMATKQGAGIYAKAFMQAQPWLPIEEEGRLGDPGLRENFISRVVVLHRWRLLLAAGLSAGSLVDFHSRHKLILLAHNQVAYRRMGKKVADIGRAPLEAFAGEYLLDLMNTLKRLATPKQHVNVLQHLMGYLKKQLETEDKTELLEIFSSYARGEIPLIVPVTLLRHHFRRHPHPYVTRQYYLSFHPSEAQFLGDEKIVI